MSIAKKASASDETAPVRSQRNIAAPNTTIAVIQNMYIRAVCDISIIAGEGKITVHAIARDVAEGLREGEMDRRVTRLEGRS